MLIVRPARLADLDAFELLAREAGPGFTSLAVGRAGLEAILAASEAAFAAPIRPMPAEDRYLLLLENTATRQICGIAGIKALIGDSKPFFNFKLLTISQMSREADRRFDLDVLVLVNEYTGCSEVGSLFVSSSLRGSGAGRLMAQARYLLMASDPQRFGSQIVSELRGVVGPDGRAPFWEHLGRIFFRMDFEQADALSARTDNQFVLDLMPKHPIYVDLLHEEARAVIGKCHPKGQGALKLLQWEGFHYDHVVDIFDGGPLLSCARDEIRTLRESVLAKVRAADPGPFARPALVSNDQFAEFRVVSARVLLTQGIAAMDSKVMRELGLSEGQNVRIWTQQE